MATAADPDASRQERVTAIRALATSKDVVGAIDSLAKALDSRDEAVREAVVASLRKQLERSDFPARLGDNSTPLKTRRNILKALRYLREDRLVPAIVERLSDADPGIRAEAALALSVFGAEKAEEGLIRALGDPDKDVRYYAADALGGLSSAAARAALADRAKIETDPTVKFSLIQAQKRQ